MPHPSSLLPLYQPPGQPLPFPVDGACDEKIFKMDAEFTSLHLEDIYFEHHF